MVQADASFTTQTSRCLASMFCEPGWEIGLATEPIAVLGRAPLGCDFAEAVLAGPAGLSGAARPGQCPRSRRGVVKENELGEGELGLPPPLTPRPAPPGRPGPGPAPPHPEPVRRPIRD